jgi:hypothetical protein
VGVYILVESFLICHRLVEADNFDPVTENSHGLVRTDSKKSEPLQPVRPKEFKSHMVLPFVIVLIGLAVVLGVLYYKSQPYGELVATYTTPRLRDLMLTLLIYDRYCETFHKSRCAPINRELYTHSARNFD